MVAYTEKVTLAACRRRETESCDILPSEGDVPFSSQSGQPTCGRMMSKEPNDDAEVEADALIEVLEPPKPRSSRTPPPLPVGRHGSASVPPPLSPTRPPPL